MAGSTGPQCGLGCTTETLGNDQQRDLNTLVEVAHVADEGLWVVMLARMSPLLLAEIFCYACSLTPISLTELSRSWCEHETISLESVSVQ